MYYEINVSLNGVHFFATSSRSITNTERLREVLRAFRTRFTKTQGFDISVSFYPNSFYGVDMDEVLGNPNYDPFKTED